jgi:hypothetical protein
MNYNSLDRAKTPKPAAKNGTGKPRDGLLIVAAFLLLLATPKSAHAQVIYVANANAGTIGEYNASTGAAINASLVTGLSNPFGLAVDGSGHLYVASANSGNSGSGTIGEYNASTGAAINTALVTGLTNSFGLVVDGSGHLYVTNYLPGAFPGSNDGPAGSIGEYNASTGAAIASLVIFYNSPSFNSTIYGYPTALALDGSGHLYVATQNFTGESINGGYIGNQIGEYSAGTGQPVYTAALVSYLTYPSGMALDGSGDLYVADAGTIEEYNASTGVAVNRALVTGLDYYTNIALDGSGNLYVANFGSDTIGEYNASTGAPINTALVTGLNGPFGIAISSVPEPGATMLIAVALVGLCAAARPRTRVKS